MNAINMAHRLLKMAEVNLHNVNIKESRERPCKRHYFDDYGKPCTSRSEQRIRHAARDAVCGLGKMLDLLEHVTCGDYNEWIRHTTYQHSNNWMRDNTIFDHSYETPTESRAKKVFAKIPKEIEKADKFIEKASGATEDK